MINVKKREVLEHIDGPQPTQSSHSSVEGSALQNTEQFTYTWNILTTDCHLDKEIQLRIKQASAAFGRFSKSVSKPKPHD